MRIKRNALKKHTVLVITIEHVNIEKLLWLIKASQLIQAKKEYQYNDMLK